MSPKILQRVTGVKRFSVKGALRSVLSFFRRSRGDQSSAPSIYIALPARLLIDSPRGESSSIQTVNCMTLNISEGSLVLVIPPERAGVPPVAKGEKLQVSLDLLPRGTVQMYVRVIDRELMKGGQDPSSLLSVRITRMSPGDRALYLKYVGVRALRKNPWKEWPPDESDL